MLTEKKFKTIFPRTKDASEWVDILNNILPQHEITTIIQISMFLAQAGHESVGFTVFSENLNYSKDGLLKIFPKYFSEETAAKSARNPKAIANIVYANRMGNGNKESGDGWNFRGRGPLQITGRDSYAKCSEHLYGDKKILLENPDLIMEKKEGIESAMWFWDSRKLSSVSDIVSATKIINGGKNGIEDRKRLFDLSIISLKQ